MQQMQVSTSAQHKNASLIVYTFLRPPRDKYPNRPVKHTGMVRSAFRPSDDETYFDYLVPSNFMAAVELRELCDLIGDYRHSDPRWAQVFDDASALRSQILEGISTTAIARSNGTFAYEADGFGNQTFMDDANVPSLLSLPLLGVSEQKDLAGFNIIYRNTRRFILSKKNPYFFSGPLASGVGSPHNAPSWVTNYVWPLSLMTQVMTATADADGDAEIFGVLQMLKNSAVGAGCMHESFNVYNASFCTRNWFAWANTFFGEMMLDLAWNKPHLVLREKPDAYPIWFPKPLLGK